jgi:hypothetical protein
MLPGYRSADRTVQTWAAPRWGYDLDEDEDRVVIFGLDDPDGTAKAVRRRLRRVQRRGRARVAVHDVVTDDGDEVRVVSVKIAVF